MANAKANSDTRFTDLIESVISSVNAQKNSVHDPMAAANIAKFNDVPVLGSSLLARIRSAFALAQHREPSTPAQWWGHPQRRHPSFPD